MPLICMPVRIAEIVQAERIGGLRDRCKFPCVGPAVIEYTAATPGHLKGIRKRVFRHGQRKDCRVARARSSRELRKANNEELVIRITAIWDALERRTTLHSSPPRSSTERVGVQEAGKDCCSSGGSTTPRARSAAHRHSSG